MPQLVLYGSADQSSVCLTAAHLHNPTLVNTTPTRPAKILIVEDEFILATNLKETLEALGYTVTGIAASFEATLRQVTQDRPDVVLMDIRLPGDWDGIEIATFLWRTFQLPAVYLTGHSDRATLERAQESLPFGYMVKLVQESELVTAIHMAYRCCQAIHP